MFARGSKYLVVLALVFVIGAHWALLQSVAWVGMAVNFSQTESFATALQKTFDGQHPCPLCKLVQAGQTSEKKQDLRKAEAKIDFQLVAGTCGLFPPRPIRHFKAMAECAPARAEAPLLPPPRFFHLPA